jgi:ATP-binding cassette subfamily B protein
MKKLIRLIRYLKPYKKEAILSLIFLTIVVFMDLAIPRLVQRIIDQGIARGEMGIVTSTSLLMLGISFLGMAFSIANNTLSVQAGEGFAKDLREDLFVKIQEFSYGNLDRIKTGNLIVRLTSDITILSQVFRMSLRIGTRAPLLMIGSIVLMFMTNVNLTLIILPLLAITLLVVGGLVVKLGPIFMQIQQKLDNLNTVLQENIAGIRVVKAFVRQPYEKERFEKVNQDFTQVNIRILSIVAALFPAVMLLVNIGILLVLWFGGRQAIEGSLTVGELVAFVNYLSTTMVPLLIMGMFASMVASGIASAERVEEVLTESPEIIDQPQTTKLPDPVKGRVEFQDVDFFYNGCQEEKILNGINFAAEPGETIAILGATGAGKSTLVNLIPRFYEVCGGRVLLDGVDIRDLSQHDLLAQIGLVPQESILFSGSVRQNIAYGLPLAADEEIIKAAQVAQAHEFITEMPEGYETHIEARGSNLSGGQKQRIAISRAILMKPKILILDDSTSSVDIETETKIQDGINAYLAGGTTIFMVAQRISTVLNADRILVIDKGSIAAQGKHAELIKSSPIYKEIYDSQLGEGNHLNHNGLLDHLKERGG